MSRLGSNYFKTCETCGTPGHTANDCPVKEHYHHQANRAVARGSTDPEIMREAYNMKPDTRRKSTMFLVLFVALMLGRAHGQAVVPPITAECATSVDGSVVGVINPLQPPVVTTVFSGSLQPANYFVVIAWYDAAGKITLPSPEVKVQLPTIGTLRVSPPLTGMPAAAVGMKVYIGTSSGAETLQGTTTGSATFSQSVPLITGISPQSMNTTVCAIIANDSGWPSGTGYNVTLTSPAGDTLPGYPMQWQLLGPGDTINLSQGLPLYNGTVNYPVPILARPYGHGSQSISGPLSLTNYNLVNVLNLGVGTATPGWGVDVEGADIQGAINANTGYLFNGLAPLNHVLLGNGNYYVDSDTISASIITGLPAPYTVGGTPTLTAGAGAGTGATVIMSPGSADKTGSFNVVTGTSPSGLAVLVTITFEDPFPQYNFCTISPIQPSSATGFGALVWGSAGAGVSGTSWRIWSGASGLTASTTYGWAWSCNGY